MVIGRLFPTPEAKLGSSGPDYARASREESGGDDLTTAVARLTLFPTPTASDADRTSATFERGNPTLTGTLLPTPTGTRYGSNQSPSPGAAVRPSLDTMATLLPTPVAADARSVRNATMPRSADAGGHQGWTLTDVALADRWGDLAAAVARHAAVLGRPAPYPTEPGAKGQPKLSGRFVEWLMGLDEGLVTDVPGLSQNDVLQVLGNGVVWQQALAGLRRIATRSV